MITAIASGRRLGSLAIGLVCCTSLATTGCFPIPIVVPLVPPAEVFAPDPHAARVEQVTTRADVLMSLGCPDWRSEDDRYFVYQWMQIHAVGAFLYSSGPALWDSHRLILEFGTDGRLVEQAEVSAFERTRADKKARKWIEADLGEGT